MPAKNWQADRQIGYFRHYNMIGGKTSDSAPDQNNIRIKLATGVQKLSVALCMKEE